MMLNEDASSRDPAEVRFDPNGLIPVIAQEETTGDVLLLAYMNAEALRLTLAEGVLVLWSRSRGKLWRKGEQSGNVLRISELRINCEGNSVLARVRLDGTAACHEGYRTCYFRRLDSSADTSTGSPSLVTSIVEPRIFDPAVVYGTVQPGGGELERDLRLLYAAYERLREEPERPESGTSCLLHDANPERATEQALARAREELEELRGVYAGTHRHMGGAADVILEASQVEYWVLLAAIAQRHPYDAWLPHVAWHAASEQAAGSGGETADRPVVGVLRECWHLLTMAGSICLAAGVQPEDVVMADLTALRGKYPELAV